ncbi:hypothetical protein PC116_g28972 [Phytophthora cactorum]|nr:hypothetical protein PC116_g28972 [Phytophthora cactorum]
MGLVKVPQQFLTSWTSASRMDLLAEKAFPEVASSIVQVASIGASIWAKKQVSSKPIPTSPKSQSSPRAFVQCGLPNPQRFSL